MGVGQVFDGEERFGFLDAARGQRGRTLFFVDDVIVILIQGVVIFLGVCFLDADRLELAGERIGAAVQVGRFLALAGNNQRGTRFIDQDGVHFVDDCKMVPALHLVFLINDHVVAQIVKAEFVVRAVGDVGGIGGAALVVGHVVADQADREPQEAMDFSHPFGVTLGKVFVDGDDVHTFAGQGVEVGGQDGRQGFTFTGLHFGDTALVQDDTAGDLCGEGTLADDTRSGFAADGESVGQNGVGAFYGDTVFEDLCLCAQLVVAHGLIGGPERERFIEKGFVSFQFFLAIVTKKFFEKIHDDSPFFLIGYLELFIFGLLYHTIPVKKR